MYQQVNTTEPGYPQDSTDHPSSLDNNNGDYDRQILDPECASIPDVEEGSSQTFSLCKISRDEKILLLMMAGCNFCAAANFSLLGPFFPEEVTELYNIKTVKLSHL
jgi:hypothetical protein